MQDLKKAQEQQCIFVFHEPGKEGMHEHFKKLGSTRNELGWYFDIKHKEKVGELCQKANMSLTITFIPGGNFEAFKRSNTLSYLNQKSSELEEKVNKAAINFKLEDFQINNPITTKLEFILNQNDDGRLLLAMINDYKKIQEKIVRINNEEMIANIQPAQVTSFNDEESCAQFQIKFINELDQNILETDIPEAPRLLGIQYEGAIHTFIRKGIVGALVSAGGVGKTHLLSQLALSIAFGLPFLEYYPVSKQGYVYLGLGEDDNEDIHRLLRKEVKNLFCDQSAKEASKRFAFNSFKGMQMHFIDRDCKPTNIFRQFLNQLKDKEPKEGWSLIILDPISRFLGPTAETDNAAATMFIALLERLTLELKGKPTVLFGHHMNKTGIGNSESNQASARGSSAITDGVRWQANLERHKVIDSNGNENDKKHIKFKVVKTNFTGFPPEQILKKDAQGCLFHHDWYKEKPKAAKNKKVKNKSKDNSESALVETLGDL